MNRGEPIAGARGAPRRGFGRDTVAMNFLEGMAIDLVHTFFDYTQLLSAWECNGLLLKEQEQHAKARARRGRRGLSDDDGGLRR